MYRTTESSFYTDPFVKNLKAPAKFLFMYLWTNAHSHVSGCYYITKKTIAKETGLNIDKIDTLLDTLYGRVLYDETEEMVWVKNMLKYQGKGARNHKSAADQLRKFPECVHIIPYLEQYPAVKTYLSDDFINRVSYRVRSQEQEQEQEQEPGSDVIGGPGETTQPALTDYEKKVETYIANITDQQIIKWKEACPHINVWAEIKKAVAWLYAVQKEQRKKRFGKFLTNWMNNAEKRAKSDPEHGETVADRVRRSSSG